MSMHSVVEAKNNLSDLLARAKGGEEIVITRHGVPVAKLSAIGASQPSPRPMTPADMAWLDANRIKPLKDGPDSATLIRQMRDEGY